MVLLKGSPKGIMISVNDVDFDTGRQELEEKLLASGAFFKDAELSVFLTSNSLTEAEVYFLRDTLVRTLKESKITFIASEPKMLPQQHSELDELEADESVTKYVRRTIKSGETLEHAHSIVIFGDVEEGGKVVAGGNVFVLGNLFGYVHAGAGGNLDAIVAAAKLLPEKLLIGDKSIKVKKSAVKRLMNGKAEMAFVHRNLIKIEQYT